MHPTLIVVVWSFGRLVVFFFFCGSFYFVLQDFPPTKLAIIESLKFQTTVDNDIMIHLVIEWIRLNFILPYSKN